MTAIYKGQDVICTRCKTLEHVPWENKIGWTPQTHICQPCKRAIALEKKTRQQSATEGWHRPTAPCHFHYFVGDYSLCGKYHNKFMQLFNDDDMQPEFEKRPHLVCKTCAAKRAERQSRCS